MQVWHSLGHMPWYFLVLVGQLLKDSSAVISVLQLPLLFAFILRSEGLTAPTSKVRRQFWITLQMRWAFSIIHKWAFSIIQWFWHKIKIPGSPERKHWLYYLIQPGKIASMKEAHSKMRNNDESDILRLNDPGILISLIQAKEATFL